VRAEQMRVALDSFVEVVHGHTDVVDALHAHAP
jgi:hypothetical protein